MTDSNLNRPTQLVFITRAFWRNANMRHFVDCKGPIDFIVMMLKTPLFSCLFSFSASAILTFSILITPSVFAQEIGQSTLELKPEKAKGEEGFQPRLEFEVRGLNYISSSNVDQAQQQQAQLDLGYSKKDFIFSDAHLILGTFSERQSFYAALPELIVGVGDRGQSFVAAGRMINPYNFLDSYYNVGLYNSYFTNDFVNYQEQGMTGIHLQYFEGTFGVQASWIPVFLPNQGPQVREENKDIVSTNRWAQRAPARFRFSDQTHDIEYTIRDYRLSDITSNGGQAYRVFWGGNSRRPLIQVAYANKPLNEIPLTRETYGSVADFVGHVYLAPVVTYHEVRSADINWDLDSVRSTFSYAEDQVQNKTAAPNETLQNLKPLKIYGIHLAKDFKFGRERELTLSLTFAELQGGEISDQTAAGNESLVSFAAGRTQFKSPITFGAAGELFSVATRAITTHLRWTYDRRLKGSLLSTELSVEAIRHLNIKLGFDLLGVEENTLPEPENNFLAQNQANDRIFGGLQYAF